MKKKPVLNALLESSCNTCFMILAVLHLTFCPRYSEANQASPKRVIFYRDGVGEGQIPYVKAQEVDIIKQCFRENGMEPQLAFVIVSKRINNK